MKSYLELSQEVEAAIKAKKPVVALESTIISHGMPYPQNRDTALAVEKIVRDAGAVPATIAVIGGKLKAGLTGDEIEYIAKKGHDVTKVSRRDFPFVLANGADGATTVAGTMIVAEMAGIKVFATGGIGGVHRDGNNTFDISADLQELAKTSVAVVCAGVKSILDIALTLEYLETAGVPVVGYGTDEFPAFYTRRSGLKVEYRLDRAEEIARMLDAKWWMGLSGGAVIANPIPEAFAMDAALINRAIESALAEAKKLGIRGKETTPFLLAKIKELTGGDSLDSNIQLVYANARLAAEIACALN